ncbi:hypothetical protein AVEN_74033-1 [Araneus ventricosus]|uniref:Uncharacterized protein n=1 Tax=Araneus ventricosus TaxID=182803 RepID=A0A4Y2IYU5_ARAVE|nr:hypothetical protein AVEN_74033-1 [Araneus ventricosus]
MRMKKTWIPFSKDFRSQKKKLKFLNYLSTSSQEIAEAEAFEVLHCDDKALTVSQLTDAEICSMVLMNSKTLIARRVKKKHKRKIKCQLTA